MSADREFIGESGILGSLKSLFGALAVGLGALMIIGFAVLVQGIRRALPGYQTTSEFFAGEEPARVPPAPLDYQAILLGLDRLLLIFEEPSTEIGPDDILLRNRLQSARARSQQSQSAHPFSAQA